MTQLIRFRLWTLVMGLAFVGHQEAQAGVFTLPVLDQTQVSTVLDALAATVVYRPMEPPSHPSVFGFWFNARVNGTDSKGLSALVGRDHTVIPFGNIQGGINIPFGIGFEFGMIPRQAVSGTTFGSYSAGLKWSFIQGLGIRLPINAAIRGFYTSANLSYQQTISEANITVDYKSGMYGGTFDISKKWFIFEPYVGYGFVSHTSTLSASGSATLFNTSFPIDTTSVTGKGTSGWFHAGLEIKLLVLALGVQYDNVYGADTVAAKAGFKF